MIGVKINEIPFEGEKEMEMTLKGSWTARGKNCKGKVELSMPKMDIKGLNKGGGFLFDF
jgi:hypothetical protein